MKKLIFLCVLSLALLFFSVSTFAETSPSSPPLNEARAAQTRQGETTLWTPTLLIPPTEFTKFENYLKEKYFVKKLEKVLACCSARI